MTTPTTPIARVAAYTAAATRRGVTIVDALPDAGDPPRRVELRASDLGAVLAMHDDLCPAVEHCQACGAVLCITHGLGEAADCAADAVHCTSPWCWDQACMDAGREDHGAEVAEDIALEACERETTP